MNRLLLTTAVAALILAAPAAFAADDHHDQGNKGGQHESHDSGPKGGGSMSGPSMSGPKMSGGGNMSGPSHTDHTSHTDHAVSRDVGNKNNDHRTHNDNMMGGNDRSVVKSKSNITNNRMDRNNGSHGHIDFNRHNVTASRHFHYRGGAWRWPSGYHYQRWSFGMMLPSIFWAQDYWINDYYDYGLAYPPAGAVWVRYGDDALLVDRYTGEILEVVYGQFD